MPNRRKHHKKQKKDHGEIKQKMPDSTGYNRSKYVQDYTPRSVLDGCTHNSEESVTVSQGNQKKQCEANEQLHHQVKKTGRKKTEASTSASGVGSHHQYMDGGRRAKLYGDRNDKQNREKNFQKIGATHSDTPCSVPSRNHQSFAESCDMDQIPPIMPGPNPANRTKKQKHMYRPNTKINCKKKGSSNHMHVKGFSSPGRSKSRCELTPPRHSKQEDQDLEIPGFYYDKEKKKYFKILPYQNNVNVITKEVLIQRAAEDLRQRDLAELQNDTKQLDIVPANRPRCSYSQNIYDLIDGMRTLNGTYINAHWSCPRFLRHFVSNLKPRGHQKIFQDSSLTILNQYEKLEHMTKMLPDPDYKRLLCLWSLKGLIVQRVQMLNVNEVRRLDEEKSVSLDIKPTGHVVLQSFSKVTHICWAPLPADENNQSANILYTTTCFLGNNPSMAFLRRMDSGHDHSDLQTAWHSDCTEFNLGCKATWTCAWNPHSLKMSIGSEKCGLLLDVKTRRLWELNTRRGDVFTQTFSHSTGQTLYSGTRRGMVCIHDLRSMSTRYVGCLTHKASVCHLHLLKDDRYLLASDFSGRICQWDLRKQQVVHEFHGHSNQYHTLPFHLDPSETILYAAGQDCYTRLWDLRSGDLLRSLPPPFPAALDNIPSLCLIPSVGHQSTIPGLCLGIQDEMHFYSS